MTMRPPGRRWPEYAIEAASLGLFMLSASAFAVLLEFPGSPVRHALQDATLRRVLMGLAMGATAVALIYSPWGRRSGAHLNPATTFTFWRLGHLKGADFGPYALAQIGGGALAMVLAGFVLGRALAAPEVHYVVTRPGPWGAGPAFAAEILMTFILMSVVLAMSCAPRLERFTGLAVGGLVWLYIALEAPVSGTSLNPARTLASAFVAHDFTALWIYLLAPTLGMALAAELHRLRAARARAAGAPLPGGCAKLRHDPRVACVFCGQRPGREPESTRAH